MAPNKTASSQALRGKTDQSLEVERVKTDEYLEQTSQSVKEETDETIRQTRLAADKEVEGHRAEVDLEKDQRLEETDSQTAQVVDTILTQERERVEGSTPLSRTVELRVVPPVAACRVSVAVSDCGTAQCSQRYQPWLRLVSDSAGDSPVLV